MLTTRRPDLLVLTLAAGFLGAAGAALAVDAGTIEVDLAYQSERTWRTRLPAERFRPVSGGFPVAHAAGDSFAAGLEGTALMVDSDGDGTLDRRVEGRMNDTGTMHARLTLRGETADGAALRYAVRLVDRGKGWEWAPGGAMTGKVGDTPIRLIDQDCDGRYDGFGTDAMVLGRREVASFLSRAVTIEGTLYALDVAPDGRRLSLRPWTGPTGTLDLTTGLSTDARLLAAVVRSADGAHSFDLAATPGRTHVPAGRYEIINGALGLGKQTVQVRRGRAEAIEVADGAAASLSWGGPAAAEFTYQRDGEQVVFDPDTIWYYGTAGEEYLGWNPIGRSPEFTVTDRASGEVLSVLILPGSS